MPWASVTRNHTPSPPATVEALHTTPQTPPKHPALWVWTPLWRSADLIMLKRHNDLTINKYRLSWEAPKECGSFSLWQSPCPLTPQSSGVAAGMRRALWAGLTFECLSSWHICEACADGRPGLLLPFLIFIISPLQKKKLMCNQLLWSVWMVVGGTDGALHKWPSRLHCYDNECNSNNWESHSWQADITAILIN